MGERVTPKELGFFAPAEWDHQEAVWTAWPSHGELWQEGLEPAQESFANLARAIASAGEAAPQLHICVPSAEADASCARALEGVRHTRHRELFGDIWLRDTAPIFLRNAAGERASAVFRFNGWGEKYALPGDDTLAGRIAALAGFRRFDHGLVLEGGSVEYDGEGTVLTTRQCLLNPNRNPSLGEAEIERQLHEALGTEKALWVTDGLLNDHTDGHIDTIARLVAPGVALCMEPSGSDDPNREVLVAIRRELEAMVDARGRKLTVHVVPSPGLVENDDGDVMPASHVNYLVTNGVVVVPLYATAYDDAVLKAFEPLFPGRRVIGVQAKPILAGGGAFHCITQQVPSGR
jgi:agmatine deiminase